MSKCDIYMYGLAMIVLNKVNLVKNKNSFADSTITVISCIFSNFGIK